MRYMAKRRSVTRPGGFYLAAMVAVLLLGFALGAAQLNADILWVDEMASVAAMGAEDPPYSVEKIVTEISQHIPDHVPLYYIIGSAWAQWVGWSQAPLRYASLLFGVLSIACLYRLGVEVFDRKTGWLAAALFASNAIVVIYFHELRNYSLWLLLSIIHIWQYWRLAVGKKTGALAWVSFAAVTGALLYTHPFSPFVLLGLGVHHLLTVAKDRNWWIVVSTWTAGVFMFLPYLPLILAGVSEATDSRSVQAEALSALDVVPLLAHVTANGVDLLWLAVIAAAGWSLWRQRSSAIWRLLLIFATVTLSLLLFHALDPFVSTRRLRYFLVALTLAILLSAHFIAAIPHWRLAASVFVVLWMAGGYGIYRQAEHWTYAGHHSLLVPHPPLHRFADALKSKVRPHEALLGFTQASFLNSGLRFGLSTVDYYSKVLLGAHGAFIGAELQGSELRHEFNRRLGHYPYLTFVYEPQDLPANFNEVQALLDAQYRPCEVVVDSGAIFARRYAYHSLECGRQRRSIAYDNGIRIIDRFADFDRQQQSIRVLTGWEVADERQLDEYNVSIQIITTDWRSVSQAPDRHLYNDVLTWYLVELSTADLPAGDYNVMVILYDRENLQRVAGTDLLSASTGDVFSALSFTIAG